MGHPAPLRRPRLIAAALLAALPVVVPVRPSAGQTASPDRLPGTRVELRADPVDRDTFIPAPVRRTAVAGEALSAASTTTTIQLSFGSGFPTQAMPAVRAALDVWAGIITSSQPITVHADYEPLGAGTLAEAGPTFLFRDFRNAPLANTFYAQPLAEALAGENLGGSDYDVVIDINTRNDWYFGTDGNTPSGRYDLMSVMLHEFLHGLGFLGTMTVSGGQGKWGLDSPPRPDIYDRFGETSNGTKLLNAAVFPSPSAALRNALQSPLFFNSPQTNRGQADRVVLYAPNPWEAGSSFAHLDELTYRAGSANSLGTPLLSASEAVHSPGPLALCMLEAMGWTTPQACTPPVPTQVTGSTWYATGGNGASGPSGTVVRAFATGAIAGRSYKLVSGLDGGTGKPCMWDVAPLNPVVRVASPQGVIASTSGVLDRGPGDWQVCFREEGTGTTLPVTAPASFTVV